jgi:hypothetical protein
MEKQKNGENYIQRGAPHDSIRATEARRMRGEKM